GKNGEVEGVTATAQLIAETESGETFIVFARNATGHLQVALQPVTVDVTGSRAFEELVANVGKGRNHHVGRQNAAQIVQGFGNLAEFGAANGLGILVAVDGEHQVRTAETGHQNTRNTREGP